MDTPSDAARDSTQRIVDRRGFARPFVRHRALADVDIADARIRSGPLVLPPPLARLRLKEWQHFCFVSANWLVTLAVVDAKYMRVAWVQVVDLTTGERFEHHRQSPIADIRVARSLWNDRTWYRTKGFRIWIHSHLDTGAHYVEVDVAASGDTPAMRGEWSVQHGADVDSLVVSLPLGRDRCLYSHKVPLPAEGSMRLGKRAIEFDASETIAVLDVHKAHYPRHMFWRWATFAGYDQKGRLVGMNLTKNVVKDDVSWNENGVWLDGRVHRLGPAVFDFDRSDTSSDWQIGSADEGVHLTFESIGSRGENLDIPGVARSRFQQLYGRFEGTVRAGDELVEIDGMLGLCEDHESVW